MIEIANQLQSRAGAIVSLTENELENILIKEIKHMYMIWSM